MLKAKAKVYWFFCVPVSCLSLDVNSISLCPFVFVASMLFVFIIKPADLVKFCRFSLYFRVWSSELTQFVKKKLLLMKTLWWTFPSDVKTSYNMWLGLTLALLSAFLIGGSVILKKKALLRLASNGHTRAGEPDWSGGFNVSPVRRATNKNFKQIYDELHLSHFIKLNFYFRREKCLIQVQTITELSVWTGWVLIMTLPPPCWTLGPMFLSLF